MSRTRMAVAFVGVAALIVAGAGCNRLRGNRAGATVSARQGGDTSADTAFLKDAAMSGHGAIELGTIAARQSTRQEVREFAQKVVDDHTAANNRIATLARARSVTVPTQADTAHKQEGELLLGLRGPDFDREYLRVTVEDHEAALAKFEHQARNAREQRVRDFAAGMLPTLRAHLERARRLAEGPAPPPGAPAAPR